MPSNTLCIRCGKIRITIRQWTELVGDHTTTHLTTACPDSDCQSIVEAQINEKHAHLALIQAKFLERRKMILLNRATKASKK